MTTTTERRGERTGQRVPPHSTEAEESVLGAILLSADAANQVMDKLLPDDFYLPAHQAIFTAIRELYNSNQVIDAVTVSEELRRSGDLERVGGVSYLTRLLDVVPAASNVEYYAGIVEEHALRRSMMKAGAVINDLAMQLDEEISAVLDRAEQTMLGVAGRRVGEGMLPIGPMFQDALEHIEQMEARGSEITGLSTGFRDLDKKLAGLQPANLVVIAARPSMGKCLVGSTQVVDAKTGARYTLAELVTSPELLALTHLASYDPVAGAFTAASPTAAQSNGVREVFEVRTATGRRIRATANHPLLTPSGWKQVDQLVVGEAVAAPARLPIFGVDRLPDTEVSRLITEVTGGRVDRVPAAVFRLPADQLARFLGGVLGVSPQAISEGKVAGRWWQPPAPGLTEEVQHLLLRFGLVASCREHLDGRAALVVHGTPPGNLLWDAVTAIEAVGEEETFDVEVPPHHNFVADDLVVHNSALTLNIATNAAQHGHPVAMFSLEMSKEEIVQRILCSVGRVDSMKLRTGQLGPLWQRVVDAASRMYRAPIFIDDSANVTVTDIRAKCRRLKRQHGLAMVVIDYLQLMQGSNRENRQQEISEISRSLKNLARELDVPILAVSQLNRSVEMREDRRPRLSDLRESGSIEQDSDVVMFIYRHDYYHPEDVEKRGQAEVIIAKHRAGATGTVEMTFMPEFTRFADLGRD